MGEVETFGITLPITDWRALFALATRADRAPSDYLRRLIREDAKRAGLLVDAALPAGDAQQAQPEAGR